LQKLSKAIWVVRGERMTGEGKLGYILSYVEWASG
jgi:hypothetical protein